MTIQQSDLAASATFQKAPMKIAIYLKHFPLDWRTLGEGTSKAVRGFATSLVAAGAEVTVLCEGDSAGERLAPGGYVVRRFAGGGRGSSFRVSPLLRAWLTGPQRPDLVLLNGMFLPSAYTLSRDLVGAGVPYILAPHDPYNGFMFRKSALRKAVYWRLCEKTVLRDSLAVQVLDGRHAQWLRRRGVQVPTVTVPCGHMPEDLPRQPLDAGRVAADRPLSFYFLGRMDAYNKGLDLLIDGFVAALGDKPARLVLQGPDWGDAASLRRRAARRLAGVPGGDGRIAFLPPAFDRTPAALMAEHDVVCVPSRYEGFSLQALEGMLAGKVVLSSDICGISPYVRQADCGVVVQPTADGVAAGLAALWERRAQWPEMGRRGRALARDALRWDDIARRALIQYRALLAGLLSPFPADPEATALAQSSSPSTTAPATAPVTILGVRVDALDMPRALDTIDGWIAGGERHYVCIRDVHGVMACQKDEQLRRIHTEAGMVTPDGMPLVWMSRRLGHPETSRVCGPDFMLELCDHSRARGYRHFLYGGAPGVVEDLKANLEARYPGLEICGAYSPPFRPLSEEEDAEVVAMINAARPDILWVGLSSPKQEYWMAAHKGRITAAAMIGVGAAFDFHAGRQKRAPLWMQRSGLEWSYRLMSEPRRLWRRYLVMAPRFLFLLAREELRGLGRRSAMAGRRVRGS
ncbi:WecB/TagA/CpsF family glycosyltransferase [Novispirillum sp. DQ9]|uniref:WecB/TagA/CpsF family glycosyltransferase n=1 Tax=Novispirillum sp. DQ9 TaxID=3398612 RepID=UPI003C7D35A1